MSYEMLLVEEILSFSFSTCKNKKEQCWLTVLINNRTNESAVRLTFKNETRKDDYYRLSVQTGAPSLNNW